jgi:tetratricopeptide (TPR) repeat protein
VKDVIEMEDPATVAAVIVEPIGHTGGIIDPPEEYLPILREVCDRYGVLLIFDEIITGMGRTGQLFAADTFGVVPDVICLGKGLSGGYAPLSAMMCRRGIADAFWGPIEENPGFVEGHTFEGNPISCAAGLAVLEEILERDLCANARTQGERLRAGFARLAEKYGIIGDLRGKGLFRASRSCAIRARKSNSPRPRRSASAWAAARSRTASSAGSIRTGSRSAHRSSPRRRKSTRWSRSSTAASAMSWEDSPAVGPWWLRRALLGTLLFVGCDGAPGGSTRFIPPAVDLESFEPEVRRQIEEQQRSAEAVPSDPEAIGRLAMLLHAYGRLDAAEVTYRAANAVAPGDDRWPCGLAHVLVERGGAAEAKSVLEEALRRNPHSAPAALGLGDLALKDADATLAKSCFAKALDASPGSPHALVGLAQAALLEGNNAEAIGRCEEALRAAPRFGKALFVEASAARAAGDPQRANDLLELHARSDKNFAPPDPILDALESLRRDSDSVLRRGNAAFQEGRFEDALQLFATALERNPKLAMAEYDLGLTLQQLGRHAEAVERYERFLAAQPRSVDGLNNLGLALQALGRRDAALERFEAALAVDPAYTTARLNMARALRASGRPDEAARHLIEALRREPRQRAHIR